MIVTVLLNLGTNDYGENALPAGEHEVSDSFGRLLVSRGHAVEVESLRRNPPQAEVTAKAEAKQGDAIAERSPVTVADVKPDNFQKMRSENDAPKTKSPETAKAKQKPNK